MSRTREEMANEVFNDQVDEAKEMDGFVDEDAGLVLVVHGRDKGKRRERLERKKRKRGDINGK